MQNVISKGKSIEEAIQLGLNLLEVTEKEVDIEIIQQATSGFIGIGRKQAIVKLSVYKGNDKHPRATSKDESHESGPAILMEEVIDYFFKDENIVEPKNQTEVYSVHNDHPIRETELEGKAWIKNNKIHVIDSPSHYPTVKIGKGVKLFKNNKLVNEHTTVITQKEQLKVELDEPTEKETNWKVTIEDNGLVAVLHVDPGYKITRTIQDVAPAEHIEIVVKESKEIINTLEYKDVMEKLNQLRIVYGIYHSEIINAATTTEPGKFLIAKGQEAQAGSNGSIELKVDVNPRNGLFEDESGKVDFREINSISIVEKGKIIAIIHPPKPGGPGLTVTNEPLPVKETFPIKLVTGKGVVEVDGRLIATESGRPMIEQRGLLVKSQIVSKLVHRDNVNLASGNIRFIGDVEIMGEVGENMLVEAGGQIFVHKSVSKSNLTTTNSIVVKGNVISSEFSAGKHNMLITELGHLLGVINGQLDKMIVLIQKLIQSPAFASSDISRKGLQPIITILLETRFKNLLSYVNNYQDVVENGQKYLDDESWSKVAIANKQTFLTLSSQVITIDHLINLSNKMKALYEFSKLPVEPDSYISMSDVINSSLYCSGDINIIGKGCINTKIHAGGHLNVLGSVRGGVVYGRLGVTINQVGSDIGIKTLVSVPHDQSIQISKAFEGTVIQIGNVKRIFEDVKTNIHACLNKEDQIVFTKL